ncbi:MAG: aldo/keto reductase [Gemmatimonadetes bacterium]|nr:aldo/keto reductase [Gemmatimonadota bacterium]
MNSRPGSRPDDRGAPWRPPPSGVIRGCWQLSRGHGPGWSRDLAFAVLDAAAATCGPLHLDCADIYTGVEELLGDWMARRKEAAAEVVVHTKCVPNLAVLPRIDRDHVRGIVLRSRDRLRRDVLDLVQLHWWDFGVPGWVRAAEWLAELRKEGVVRHIGVTNFGTDALRSLLDAGIPIVTNQVQFSLLDRRPLGGLTDLCAKRGVMLLGYGTLAGGLLADGFLSGALADGLPSDGSFVDAAPTDGMPVGAAPTDSRSLAKYRLILDEVGGPAALERARAALSRIAVRHGASMADAAAAYALAQPAVGAVIIGLSRRRLAAHPGTVRLGPGDLAALEATVPATVPGAVYEAERNRTGPHGRIMRYDLNRNG